MIRILAMETSSRRGSVAVGCDGALLEERALGEGRRHAGELLPAIRDLCAAQGWRPGELEQVYLSLGPGSFTGLRIAVAVARSLHQALGCQLVGVPTLDVVAQNAPDGVTNLVVVLDAKRGQVFAARYGLDAGGARVRTAGPELADPAAFVRATPRPVAVMGEGVAYHRGALAGGVDRPEELMEVAEEAWRPRAGVVLRLGWERALRGAFADPAAILPVYIRLAEAEEVWRRKQGRTDLTGA